MSPSNLNRALIIGMLIPVSLAMFSENDERLVGQNIKFIDCSGGKICTIAAYDSKKESAKLRYVSPVGARPDEWLQLDTKTMKLTDELDNSGKFEWAIPEVWRQSQQQLNCLYGLLHGDQVNEIKIIKEYFEKIQDYCKRLSSVDSELIKNMEISNIETTMGAVGVRLTTIFDELTNTSKFRINSSSLSPLFDLMCKFCPESQSPSFDHNVLVKYFQNVQNVNQRIRELEAPAEPAISEDMQRRLDWLESKRKEEQEEHEIIQRQEEWFASKQREEEERKRKEEQQHEELERQEEERRQQAAVLRKKVNAESFREKCKRLDECNVYQFKNGKD